MALEFDFSDGQEDTRAQKTIANLMRYNLKRTIYNLLKALKQVPRSTLANPLLRGHWDMWEVFEGLVQELQEVKGALDDDKTVTEQEIYK